MTAKAIALAIPVGFAAGTAAAIFLHLLNWSTHFRLDHPWILWGLPLAGFIIGRMYHSAGKEAASGHALILEEIRNPKKQLPPVMIPLVLCATILTHLFGGSAGREGTAVQMGGSLADQLLRYFKVSALERRRLLIAGMGAGFSAAIGAPFAGSLFGLEVIVAGRWRKNSFGGLLECTLASFVAFYTAMLWQAPHSSFPWRDVAAFDITLVLWALVAGLAFGFMARFFILFTHVIEKSARRLIRGQAFIPVAGGALLVALFHLEGSYRFNGLGIAYIQEALLNVAPWTDPILKTVFTALTLGTGFKGGEFVPLVFIGTTLGSSLSAVIPLAPSFLGSLGFGALFGAAAKTPLACVVMVMEIFGWRYGVYALAAGYAAFCVSGKKGIYL